MRALYSFPHRDPSFVGRLVLRRQRNAFVSVLALATFFATACSKKDATAPLVCTVNQVTVAPATTSLVVGGTSQFVAGVNALNCSTAPAVTWTSSAPTVAGVTGTGLVNALTVGTATITASAGGVSATASVTVNATPVATITIAPTTVALDAIGKSQALTPTFRDAAGGITTGGTLTWTTSNATVATVSTAGVVTSVGPGSATISATAGAVSGAAAVTVTVVRFAYAWAEQATAAAAYTPFPRYSFNQAGGSISAVRLAAGRYNVTFGGLAKRTGNTETVIVTAYGVTVTRCVVENWGTSSNTIDLDVNVACVNPSGAATDAQFTIMVVGNGTLPRRLGFAWNDQPAVTAYTPNGLYSHSSAGTPPTATRSSAGAYQSLLNVPRGAADPGENYFVTAYGAGAAHCKVAFWNFGTSVNAQCYDNAGNPADSRYNSLLVSTGRTGARFAIAWASSGTSVTAYDAVGVYGFTSSGSTIMVARSSVGTYNVTFTGLATPATKTETIAVTSYGGNVSFCRVISWGNSGSDLLAQVQCTTAAGVLTDSQFTIMVIE